MPSNLHPAILLTKNKTVFATISKPGQIKAWEIILLTKAMMVFTTTRVMPVRYQQIKIGTGKAINTDMVLDMDVGILSEGKFICKVC